MLASSAAFNQLVQAPDTGSLNSQCGLQAAHARLWAMRRFLSDNEQPVPKALEQALASVHSYLLVKRLVKREDHAVSFLASCNPSPLVLELQ